MAGRWGFPGSPLACEASHPLTRIASRLVLSCLMSPGCVCPFSVDRPSRSGPLLSVSKFDDTVHYYFTFTRRVIYIYINAYLEPTVYCTELLYTALYNIGYSFKALYMSAVL